VCGVRGAAMAASSAFVVGTSVRLRRFAAPAAGPPGSPRPRLAAPPQPIASAREGAPHGQVT